MKDDFGEECVKKGLLTFQGKIETNAPDSFYSFEPTCLPVSS